MSPGRINYDDLSKEDRRKLAGRIGKTKRTREVVRKSDRSGRDKYRSHCADCGAVFTAYAPAQRHATQPGHRRIVVDLW